jgi:hypothetical protein
VALPEICSFSAPWFPGAWRYPKSLQLFGAMVSWRMALSEKSATFRRHGFLAHGVIRKVCNFSAPWLPCAWRYPKSLQLFGAMRQWLSRGTVSTTF